MLRLGSIGLLVYIYMYTLMSLDTLYFYSVRAGLCGTGLPQEWIFLPNPPERWAPSAVWSLGVTLLPRSGPFRTVGVNLLEIFFVSRHTFCFSGFGQEN